MERQLGHLSLTAPTGNHVIESHSPCDCHLAYDRFPQNTPQSSVYINTIPKNLSRGHPSSITSHKVSLPARSSSQNRESSITREQADARMKNYSGCIYMLKSCKQLLLHSRINFATTNFSSPLSTRIDG